MSGTLTGIYHCLDGTPDSGYVEIVASVPVIRDGDGNVLLSGTLRCRLVAGVFIEPVPATSGDVGLDPQGVTYTVTPHLRTGTLAPVVGVAVEQGETVSVTEVTPVDPDAPTYAQQVSRADFDALVDEVDGLAGGGGGGGGAVSSVNTKTGAVVLVASDVGADAAGAAAAAQAAAVTAAATDATSKVAGEASARATAITAAVAALGLGSASTHPASDFDTPAARTSAIASAIAALALGTAATHAATDFDAAGAAAAEATLARAAELALRNVTDTAFRAALIAFLTDSYEPLQGDTGWRDLGDVAAAASLPSPYEMHVYVRRQGTKVRWRVIGAQAPTDYGGIIPSLGVGWRLDGPGTYVQIPIITFNESEVFTPGRALLGVGASWDGAMYALGTEDITNLAFEFEHATDDTFPAEADWPGTPA